jgi:hypothetical protein
LKLRRWKVVGNEGSLATQIADQLRIFLLKC